MAHLSGDKGLLEAFAEGRDIHAATAAEVFGVALEKVSGDQRRSAKAINFGLIYGMSAWGLGRQLHIERSQAQTYIDRYFDRYPGVARYMDRIRAQAAEDGYVETVFGRRLYLPEIRSQNRARRQGAERTAINAPMQGTAADIIKRAMIDVDAWLGGQAFDAPDGDAGPRRAGLRGGVRLRQGRMDDETIFSDDPVGIAQRWVAAGARRLHIVDLDGPRPALRETSP
jgi:DNA polymerase I